MLVVEHITRSRELWVTSRVGSGSGWAMPTAATLPNPQGAFCLADPPLLPPSFTCSCGPCTVVTTRCTPSRALQVMLAMRFVAVVPDWTCAVVAGGLCVCLACLALPVQTSKPLADSYDLQSLPACESSVSAAHPRPRHLTIYCGCCTPWGVSPARGCAVCDVPGAALDSVR